MPPCSLDAKRAKNIADKEEQRRAKNEELKQKKMEMAKNREEAKSAAAMAEEKKRLQLEETNKLREARIAEKEKLRAEKVQEEAGKPKQQSSKVSKKEILDLKKVFDDYDKDESGAISQQEWVQVMKERKQKAAPRPGQKSTLEERQQNEGISLMDVAGSAFGEMDVDGDGNVTFYEIVKIMYGHKCAKSEIETMMTWVAKEPEPEPEPEAGLSDDAKQQIKAIFKLYDKDKSGCLSATELKKALAKTGLSKEEIDEMYQQYDIDASGSIEHVEFEKLMKDTGAFDDA